MKVNFTAVCAACYLFLLSCTGGNARMKYQQLVKQQLARPAGNQRAMLDIHFGMTSAAFYDYCRAMNAKQKFTNSSGNQWVQFRADTAFPAPVVWNFYPEFYKDRISKVKVILSYDGFAPWNHQLFADSLLKDIIPVFNRWYGPGNYVSILINDTVQLIKVDSNRQISFWKLNEKDIQIVYTDLSVASNL